MENIVQKLSKNKVVIVTIFSLTLHFILLLSSVASNQWITGKSRYSADYTDRSYGLWNGCILDRSGSQIYCESFVSSSWLDGVKAFAMIPLICLGLLTPLILWYGWNKKPLEQLGTVSASYKISIVVGIE